MTRLVAILVTLFLVAIPAKADVTLSPPVQGWTVIKVYGEIQLGDLDTFLRYTENVNPAATLVLLSLARAATSRLVSAWVYAFTRRS